MGEGRVQRLWATSLAGAYAPALCRAWARVACASRPSLLPRDGPKMGRAEWEADLRKGIGGEAKTVVPGAADQNVSALPKDGAQEWPANAQRWGGRFALGRAHDSQ